MIGDEKDQVRKEDELNRQVLTDPVPFLGRLTGLSAA